MANRLLLMCVLAGCITFSAGAQYEYINLQGCVFYRNGRPVKNATVQLLERDFKNATDSVGVFSLRGAVTSTSPYERRTCPTRFSITSTHCRFIVTNPTSPVAVDLFEPNGTKYTTLVSGTFPLGEFMVPIQFTKLSDKLYLIRVRIGTLAQTICMPLFRNAPGAFSALGANELREPARLSEAIKLPQDTLIIRSESGAVKKIPVDTIYSVQPLLIVFDNNDEGSLTDDALMSFPVIVPVVQQSCFRWCTYTFTQKPVLIEPEFTSDIASYVFNGPDSVVCINPVTRSPQASVTVALDGDPCPISPWYSYSSSPYPILYGGTVSGVVYSCTLRTVGVQRTFSAMATSQDGSNSMTYDLTMTRTPQ